MPRVTRKCLECGETFAPRQYSTDFCAVPCRQKFNNRRATRGAMLYDLMMLPEVDMNAGGTNVAPNPRERVPLLIARWKEEDGGKRTHQRRDNVLAHTQYLMASIIVPKF